MKIKGKVSKEDVLELVRGCLTSKGIRFISNSLAIAHVRDYDDREFDGVEFDIELSDPKPTLPGPMMGAK